MLRKTLFFSLALYRTDIHHPGGLLPGPTRKEPQLLHWKLVYLHLKRFNSPPAPKGVKGCPKRPTLIKVLCYFRLLMPLLRSFQTNPKAQGLLHMLTKTKRSRSHWTSVHAAAQTLLNLPALGIKENT